MDDGCYVAQRRTPLVCPLHLRVLLNDLGPLRRPGYFVLRVRVVVTDPLIEDVVAVPVRLQGLGEDVGAERGLAVLILVGVVVYAFLGRGELFCTARDYDDPRATPCA